jgi:putative ABC transport system substrate-binding protein
MNHKLVSYMLCALLITLCSIADAQPLTKTARIGYLTTEPLSAISARTEAFRLGLRQLGYVEGKNIAFEWRDAQDNIKRLTEFAAELVRLKVDIIVTAGGNATRSAKKATAVIPIVITQDRDPVANGFIASLARPGGNITGLSRMAPELSGKKVELLKEIVPVLSRLAILGRFKEASRVIRTEIDEIERAADVLGVKLQYVDIQSRNDIEPAFRAARKAGSDAVLWLVPGPAGGTQRPQIAKVAVKSRLPAMYEEATYVEAGGLMSYGVHLPDLDRRAAIYVDKILKGAKPADLPVEQPTKFEFVINLKTATQIGLTIPPNVLTRADR